MAREPQELCHPVRRVHIVIDDEDPGRVWPLERSSPASLGFRPGPGFGGREPDDELTPLAGAFARGGDGAAVELGQRPDEREPDAEPPFERSRERSPWVKRSNTSEIYSFTSPVMVSGS